MGTSASVLVPLEPVRSAEPPMRHGKASAIAAITRWFATRVRDRGPLIGEASLQSRERLRESGWQIARHGSVEGGPAALVERGTARLPGRSRVPSPLADGAPGLKDRVRHREGRMGPAQPLAGARDLLGPEGRAMARGSTGLRRRAGSRSPSGIRSSRAEGSALAAAIAAATASGSWPSTRCVCQPADSKRARASSEKARLVGPSMEMSFES